MAIDWSLARGQGNAFAAAMDGYEAGRALAKERGVQNALATYQSDPAKAEAELMRFDPEAGIRLQRARATQEREATTYAQGQEDRVRQQQIERTKLAGQLLQGVKTPEAWEAARSNPQLAELVPGIADAPFEKVAQLRQMGLSLIAKPPESVTLSLGQKRFGPDGEVIAEVAPAAVRPVVVGQGAVALGADGKPVFSNPKTYAPPRATGGGGGAASASPVASSGPAPSGTPNGPKPRADWGQGAVEMPDGSIVRYGPRGGLTVLSKPQTAAAIPQAVRVKLADNAAGIEQIDQAITAIDANPGALGLKNFLPNEAVQVIDSNGVPVRAAIANIGSLVINKRSGAAVTVAEMPRLKPFIPAATDSPDVAKKKLRELQNQIRIETNALSASFAPNASTTAKAAPSAPTLPPQAASQLKPGQVTTFANGQRWTLANGKPVQVK